MLTNVGESKEHSDGRRCGWKSVSDAFAEMRRRVLQMRPTSDSWAALPDGDCLDWKLEVMDRIEAIERFLDRDDDE
ncbi:MAG: hypothetical protein JWM34_4835 [Ilumatobacteraceae bacterium]|nr:hypothetical protein [Ilumatobacteraceae bacterium]